MHLTRSRIQFARHRHKQTGAHMHIQAETRAKARREAAKALRFAKFAMCLHSEMLTMHIKHIL